MSIAAAQKAFSTDQINQVEINVDDLNLAGRVAPEIEKVAGARYTTTTWMERNKQILGALRMERLARSGDMSEVDTAYAALQLQVERLRTTLETVGVGKERVPAQEAQ